MHKAALQYIAQALRSIGGVESKRILEIGSRNINGSPRQFCAGAAAYVGIDRLPGDDVDLVCDAAAYDPVDLFDIVICAEVLEHAPHPSAIIACAWRSLAPGGVLILTAAGEGRAPHSGIDGGPLRTVEFYQNVTDVALRSWLSGWYRVMIDRLGEDIRATAYREQTSGLMDSTVIVASKGQS